MSGILRGTTPSFVIKVKKTDFDVGDVTKLEITIWNGPLVTQYGLNDVTVDTENNAFIVDYTEQETLAFNDRLSFCWQMRCMFQDGHIVGTLMSGPLDVAALKSKVVMSE